MFAVAVFFSFSFLLLLTTATTIISTFYIPETMVTQLKIVFEVMTIKICRISSFIIIIY